MKKRMYGKITPTKAAPRRQALQLFGGPLPIEEFRNVNNNVIVSIPGEMYFPINVEVKSNHITQPKVVDDDQKLVLRREKPLLRETPTNSFGVRKKK
jgi:hypothetical protein